VVRSAMRGRYLVRFIIGLGIFWIANAVAANELRCTELGSNCIASEPLNTNTFVENTSSYFNPADTTTKQMTLIGGGFPGACVEEAGFAKGHQSDTSGEMFNALPNRSPSIQFLLRTANGGGGFLGHELPASAPTARVAFRWYMYFSPTFQFNGGGCLNSGKMFELGETATPLVWTSNGTHTMYGWNGWTPTLDCCVVGPGGSFPYNPTTMNGKWWRFEVVVRNTLTTGGTIIQTFRKNVTDNLPEQKILDTSIATKQPVGDQWSGGMLTPRTKMTRFAVTTWRDGTCGGYHGVTHMLAAAWDTDAGQRIGPATEIEGGLDAPGNLRISKLIDE
jgi:hypothetical protein